MQRGILSAFSVVCQTARPLLRPPPPLTNLFQTRFISRTTFYHSTKMSYCTEQRGSLNTLGYRLFFSEWFCVISAGWWESWMNVTRLGWQPAGVKQPRNTLTWEKMIHFIWKVSSWATCQCWAFHNLGYGYQLISGFYSCCRVWAIGAIWFVYCIVDFFKQSMTVGVARLRLYQKYSRIRSPFCGKYTWIRHELFSPNCIELMLVC